MKNYIKAEKWRNTEQIKLFIFLIFVKIVSFCGQAVC